MHWDDASAFVTHKERSMSSKRMFLNWNTALSDFDSTDANIVGVQVLFGLFEVSKSVEVDLFVGAMIAKNMELFHGFHLFTIVGFVGDVDDLLETECACTSDDAPDVVFLPNIVQKQVPFWDLFLHIFFYQLYNYYLVIWIK